MKDSGFASSRVVKWDDVRIADSTQKTDEYQEPRSRAARRTPVTSNDSPAGFAEDCISYLTRLGIKNNVAMGKTSYVMLETCRCLYSAANAQAGRISVQNRMVEMEYP